MLTIFLQPNITTDSTAGLTILCSFGGILVSSGTSWQAAGLICAACQTPPGVDGTTISFGVSIDRGRSWKQLGSFFFTDLQTNLAMPSTQINQTLLPIGVSGNLCVYAAEFVEASTAGQSALVLLIEGTVVEEITSVLCTSPNGNLAAKQMVFGRNASTAVLCEAQLGSDPENITVVLSRRLERFSVSGPFCKFNASCSTDGNAASLWVGCLIPEAIDGTSGTDISAGITETDIKAYSIANLFKVYTAGLNSTFDIISGHSYSNARYEKQVIAT